MNKALWLLLLVTAYCCSARSTEWLNLNRASSDHHPAATVLTYHIPGTIKADIGRHAVLLHVFLRIVKESTRRYRLNGFLYASSVTDDYVSWGGGIFSMPPGAVGWRPDLRLQQSFSNKNFQIAVAEHGMHTEVSPTNEPRLVMPFTVKASFETTESTLQLRIDDWDMYEFLPLPSGIDALPASDDYTVVLPPLYGLAPDKAAQLIAVNARYHHELGLKSLVYVAPPYFQAYSKDPCIAQLQLQHRLQLVVWDLVPASLTHPYGHKPLVYSHALLSSWASMYLMIDVDEFLIVPKTAAGAEKHIRSCVGKFSQATAYRCDTVLNSTSLEPDVHLWGSSNTCSFDVLKQYGALGDCHILSAGKSFANSSHVSAYAIHTGHVASGNDSAIDAECLGVLHIVNLMSHRVDYSVAMKHVSHWKWIFDLTD